MPDDKKPAAGDHDFDAALSAWERSDGNTPDPALHPALARLRAQFAAHPEVCALTRVLDTAQNDASDPVPVTVTVQPGLLALAAHVESLNAVAAGRAPAPVERVLGQALNNHLEHLLHGLVTDPTSHPHYTRLWNMLCAEAEQPGFAIPDGQACAEPKEDVKGSF